MLAHLRPALVVTVFFTLLLGVAYPLAVTGIAQIAWPVQANGSLVRDGGKVVGSSLIGQGFAGVAYLHPRPSAAGKGYDASASSGSNYGPLNPDLIARVKADTATIRKEIGGATPPADAVTTSGSGLDPHISPAYAALQAPRIAAARHVPVAQVQAEIDRFTTQPFLGFIGQPAVNVLLVNRALDRASPAH